MKIIGLVFLSVLLSAGGQLLLRAGASVSSEALIESPWSPLEWSRMMMRPGILAGLGCWGLATLVWIYVLTTEPLTYVYCLYSMNYIVVPLAAHCHLNESLSRGNLLGMLAILIGIIIVFVTRQEGMNHVGS